jgi:hypothetical protein
MLGFMRQVVVGTVQLEKVLLFYVAFFVNNELADLKLLNRIHINCLGTSN